MLVGVVATRLARLREGVCVVVAATLLACVSGACGTGGKPATGDDHGVSQVAIRAARVAQIEGGSARPYLNDRDADTGGVRENSGYRDLDDATNFTYNRPAGTMDAHAVTAVATRYYAAARAGDGRVACSLLDPELAKAVPLDYGRFGPVYLRGARTCKETVTRLFAHDRGQLASPVAVTGVLVDGNRAYALLGSPSLPASYLSLQREGSVWRVDTLLGIGMP